MATRGHQSTGKPVKWGFTLVQENIYTISLAFFAVPKKEIVGILMNKILQEVYLVGIFA